MRWLTFFHTIFYNVNACAFTPTIHHSRPHSFVERRGVNRAPLFSSVLYELLFSTCRFHADMSFDRIYKGLLLSITPSVFWWINRVQTIFIHVMIVKWLCSFYNKRCENLWFLFTFYFILSDTRKWFILDTIFWWFLILKKLTLLSILLLHFP